MIHTRLLIPLLQSGRIVQKKFANSAPFERAFKHLSARCYWAAGYGLAVANAQHDIAELVKTLRARNVNVR